MYQTPRAFEHHPRLENLFDPAARPVRVGASSPPGSCSQNPVRARVIEHAFEVREAPTPPDMSQVTWAEGVLGVEFMPWQREVFRRYFLNEEVLLTGAHAGSVGTSSPESRAETRRGDREARKHADRRELVPTVVF